MITKLGLTARSARRWLVAWGILGGLSAVVDFMHGAIAFGICGALAVIVAGVSLTLGPVAPRRTGKGVPTDERR